MSRAYIGVSRVATIASLADLTTLRLGGPAGNLVEAREEDELIDAVRVADEAGEAVLVLGGGSNLVAADSGFPGTVVRIATRGVELGDGGALTVAAGEPWDGLVERTVSDGLAGFECLAGIPGLTGATPIQNVGAYGQDVEQTLARVRAWDRQANAVLELGPENCGFGYRTSVFKKTPGRWVVLSVAFALEPATDSKPIAYPELARTLGVEVGERAPLVEVREAVLGLRRGKGMVLDAEDPDTNSAGSFFTNPILAPDAFAEFEARAGDAGSPPRFPEEAGVKTSAAWLVERAGFGRGYGEPAAIRISTKHTLALTNHGGGTAEELVRLATEIRDGVLARFGVELVPEPVFAGLDWPGPS